MSDNKKTHLIYNYLLDIIKENKYIDSFKLPSENKLAERFNSSRMCAQLAYAKLEKEHYIIKKKGSGCFINTNFVLGNTNTNNFTEAKIAVLGPGMSESRFLSAIYAEINNSFIKQGLIPSFFFTSPYLDEEKILQMLVTKRYDAIIFYPQYSDSPSALLQDLVNKNFPVVLIDRYYNGLNAYTVSSNHFASSYKIVEYLYNKGRRKILFISEAPIYSSIKHRFNGYKTALTHFPILEQKSKELLYDGKEIEQFKKTLSHYIENKEFDAIITYSGAQASDVLSCIDKYDLKVGKDILLALYDEEVSFDNVIDFPYIKLIQNTSAIGETATMIVKMMLTHQPLEELHYNIPTILKEVNTTH